MKVKLNDFRATVNNKVFLIFDFNKDIWGMYPESRYYPIIKKEFRMTKNDSIEYHVSYIQWDKTNTLRKNYLNFKKVLFLRIKDRLREIQG